ncbi:MAG: molybdopterin converting factor subunit 1 [Rhodocyclaceae bacterium]|nr:molybdopterin converting factor subunit 1 [Rhodocyclaceae bacterium]
MDLKVLYFAGLREALGCGEEKVALPVEAITVGGLRSYLASRGEAWAPLASHRNLRAAVNQRMVGPEAPLAAGDEVAFFPPVTGG